MTQRSRVSVKLVNKWGLHAKASFRLATVASGYQADIIVEKDGATADAKRMDELLLLIAEVGDTLHITATGPDGPAAAENIAGIIRSGFDEG
ncbi:MAG: HPr family phosphocarrier protein [Nitrospinota bacterium]|nr:HPr family phosphocarrier protein [Nitrospinota bacterium]